MFKRPIAIILALSLLIPAGTVSADWSAPSYNISSWVLNSAGDKESFSFSEPFGLESRSERFILQPGFLHFSTESEISQPPASNLSCTIATFTSAGLKDTYTLSDALTFKSASAGYIMQAGFVCAALYFDTVTPTVSINNNAQYATSGSITLSIKAQDNIYGTGFDRMQFSNDATNWSQLEDYADTKSWNLSAGDGFKRVYARFADGDGSVSAACSDAIILDTIAPGVTIVQPTTPTSQNVSLSYAASDNISALAGITIAGNNSPYTAEGLHAVSFTATDRAGNQSISNEVTFTIDRTGPEVAIASPAADEEVSGQIEIIGTADDPNFHYYQVSYAHVDEPDDFYSMAFAYSTRKGQRLATWPTGDCKNGRYILKLHARDHLGHASEQIVNVEVNNGFLIMNTFATYTVFSPNGDLARDTTKIISQMSENADWQIKIENESGNIVRTYSGQGCGEQYGLLNDVFMQEWDGRDNSSNIVGDGRYRYWIEAAWSGKTASTEPQEIVVDTTVPTAEITAPADGSAVKEGVEIRVAVNDEFNAWYSIYYGEGASPDSWNSITTNRSCAPPDSFLSVWNTFDRNVADGLYTLKLVVRDEAFNESVDTAQVTVDNDFVIYDYQVSPVFISPNGDGNHDVTTVSAQTTEPANWTFAIRDSSGNTLCAFISMEGSTDFSFNWTGTDAFGNAVSDGTYTYFLKASAGARATEPITGTIIVDTIPPTNTITYPSPGQKVAGTLPIVGTATDTNFYYYHLTCAKDEDSPYWSSISGLSQTGKTDELIYDWSIASREDGEYLLKLESRDHAQNTSEIIVPITVENNTQLNNFTVEPGSFSPNGDGTKDITNITAAAGTEVEWHIGIYDMQNNLIMESSATGASISLDWDGKDASGQLMPDDTYIVRASYIQGPGMTTPQSRMVVVDTTSPVASFTSPQSDETISGDRTITGTAEDKNIKTWILYYGKGENPQGWTSLTHDHSNRIEEALHSWLTGQLDNGLYKLRLHAEDNAGNITDAYMPVNIYNVAVRHCSDAPDPFSPNGDENYDYVAIRAETNDIFDWTVTIKDSDGTTLKSLSDTAKEARFDWDGKNENGDVVTDGTYNYEIIVTDPAGGASSEPFTGEVTIDTVAPEVEITSHNEGDLVQTDIIAMSGRMVEEHKDRVFVYNTIGNKTHKKYTYPPNESGDFTVVDIPLKHGENELIIEGRDDAYNKTEFTLNIRYDKAPVLKQIGSKSIYLPPEEEGGAGLASSAVSVQAEDSSIPTIKGAYVPGEVIVKFKPAAATKLQQADTGTLVRTAAYGSSTPSFKAGGIAVLDRLNREGKVKRLKQMFKSLGGQVAAPNKSIGMVRISSVMGQSVQGAQAGPKQLDNIYKLEISDSDSGMAEIIKELNDDPDVEYAEPNLICHILNVPDDPYYSSSNSWGQGYDDMWGLKKIAAEQAWDITEGSADIVVAIIDTGLDSNHPDLSANIWINEDEIPGNGIDDDGNGYVDDVRGWDFAYSDNNPYDGHGHGTHCAGIIAAATDNGQGIAGVSWHSRVMAVKGLDDGGSGYISSLVDAIKYAADNGARVLSNSWGGSGASQVLEDAVAYAVEKGCVVVAAAGNDNADAMGVTPANIKDAITVASSDHYDKKSDFSNWGMKIDIAAPGGDSNSEAGSNHCERNILSLCSENTDMYDDDKSVIGGIYYRARGTSMACPYVSGVAALILARHPELNNEEVRQVLRRSSDDTEDPLGDDEDYIGFDVYTGYGRLNAYKAVQAESSAVARIDSPANNTALDPESSVEIRGSASARQFAGYRVEYSSDRHPQQWHQISSSATPVQDGVLATFDTTPLPLGENILRVVVTTDSEEFEDRVLVTVGAANQQPGFPVECGGAVSSSPAVLDINQGSHMEIIVGCEDGRVYSWHSRGNVSYWFDTEGEILSSPACADIDGDADIEVVVGSNDGKIYAWHHDNSLVSGWPVETGDWVVSSPVLADIDNDNDLEIIVGSKDKKLYVLHHDGTPVSGWPKETGGDIESSPAVGDIDGDGDLEIAIASNDKKLYIWHHDATALSGWPKETTEVMTGSPSLGDIDGDGMAEIAIGSEDGNLYIWHGDGTAFAGWPIKTGGTVRSSPTLCDLDGDSDLEIIVGSNDTKVYAWHHNGSLVDGWPTKTDGFIYSSASCGDIDGDGDMEVVIGSNDSKVYAWHHNGTTVNDWPFKTRGCVRSSPAIADIDLDGDNEVIFGSDDGYVYAVDTSGKAQNVEWPFFRNNNENTAYHSLYVDGYNGLLVFTLSAYDPDGDPLIYSAENLPDGAEFSPQSRTFRWEPREDQLGIYQNIHFEVTDGTLTASEDITIEVRVANRPPVLSGIGDKAVVENEVLQFTIQADDVDADPLKYSVTNMPEGAAFDVSTKIFSWRPDYTQSGTYSDLTFAVSDGRLIDSESITIAVSNVNRPPEIGEIDDATINEGELLEFVIVATDADYESLTYTVINKPTGAVFDESSHKFSWRPGFEQAGDYYVSFRVSDGEASYTEDVEITVSDRSEDTTPPTAPTVDAVDALTNVEVQHLSGTKESDASVLINGGEVVALDADESWECDYQLNEGTNQLSITSEDPFGNESAATEIEIVLDLTAPVISITSPSDGDEITLEK